MDDEPDLMAELGAVLAQLSDGDTLTGFAVVAEWMSTDGERSLSLLRPTSTPPWELQGWLYHVMQDVDAFTWGVEYGAEDDDDE